MNLREAIQADQYVGAYANRLKWWELRAKLGVLEFSQLCYFFLGYHDSWRLLAAIDERTNFWRDERYRDRYGVLKWLGPESK